MEHYYHNLISVATGKKVTDIEGELVIPSQWGRRLLPGLILGCRYWFTPQLAGNVEIGYGPAFLNIGGSYRF